MHLPAHLPGPLRAAVGLVASAADEAKNLPDRAIELPMLAVSTALQLSLRAQQRYAQLTVRGDEALSRSSTSDEPPAWATFDDDSIAPSQPASAKVETSVTADPDEPASAPISGSGPVPADADPGPAPTPPPAAEKQSATRRTAARKAASKKAPTTTSDGKGVSAPRHTPPSRFDTIGDE